MKGFLSFCLVLLYSTSLTAAYSPPVGAETIDVFTVQADVPDYSPRLMLEIYPLVESSELNAAPVVMGTVTAQLMPAAADIVDAYVALFPEQSCRENICNTQEIRSAPVVLLIFYSNPYRDVLHPQLC